MITVVDIKPLSVNVAWCGRRVKTKAYQDFEKKCLFFLPKLNIPKEGPYEVFYCFGFSNRSADLANPEKLITDILCKKYGFDDRYIEKMTLMKEIVEKGKEYFAFEIKKYERE